MSASRITLKVTTSIQTSPTSLPDQGPQIRVEIHPYVPLDELMRTFGKLGAIPALPCLKPGLEEIPALVFFTLQNVVVITDAFNYAIAFRNWWADIQRKGETPEAKITYRDGDDEHTLHIKGDDLDVNRVAELFFKGAAKKKP